MKESFRLEKKVVNGMQSINLLLKMKNFQILSLNFRGKTDWKTANFCVDLKWVNMTAFYNIP